MKRIAGWVRAMFTRKKKSTKSYTHHSISTPYCDELECVTEYCDEKPVRMLFKIPFEDYDPELVDAYIKEVTEKMKKPVVDPQTGEILGDFSAKIDRDLYM